MQAPLRPLVVTLELRTVPVLLVPFCACSEASEARGPASSVPVYLPSSGSTGAQECEGQNRAGQRPS